MKMFLGNQEVKPVPQKSIDCNHCFISKTLPSMSRPFPTAASSDCSQRTACLTIGDSDHQIPIIIEGRILHRKGAVAGKNELGLIIQSILQGRRHIREGTSESFGQLSNRFFGTFVHGSRVLSPSNGFDDSGWYVGMLAFKSSKSAMT